MRFSLKQLNNFFSNNLELEEVVKACNSLGLEVEEVQDLGGQLQNVVVGLVKECTKHPNADKLNLTQVDLGNGDLQQIVCGAANVKAGIKVPVAKTGAILPNNFKIKKTKIRGVESNGMICSESELGLAKISEGIMLLDDSLEIGRSVKGVLGLDDAIIEIDLTPNRSDCFSLLGIARDLAAYFKLDLIYPKLKSDLAFKSFPIKILDEDACPSYQGLILKNFDNSITSPSWLIKALEVFNTKSTNFLVDLTNYVMFELGQPLHSFDKDKINGGIKVLTAANNFTEIKLLNASSINLKKDELLIADDGKPLALAGIMGAYSCTTELATKNIFIESAFFSPSKVKGVARRFGFQTEASLRFERGVDPLLPEITLARFAHLLKEIVPDCDLYKTDGVKTKSLDKYLNRSIKVDINKINSLLGNQIEKNVIVDILTRLNFVVAPSTNDDFIIDVKVPSYRLDVEILADIAEEITRVYGFNKIKTNSISINFAAIEKGLKQPYLHKIKIKSSLALDGFNECINYSFHNPLDKEIYNQENYSQVALENPINKNFSHMRLSLWPSLLANLEENLKKSQESYKLFEMANIYCFNKKTKQIKQTEKLAGLICGKKIVDSWADDSLVNFFDLKGQLTNLFDKMHVNFSDLRFVPFNKFDKENRITNSDDLHEREIIKNDLHPGIGALILADFRGKTFYLGYMGQLHPKITNSFNIKNKVFIYEVNSEILFDAIELKYQYKKPSKFPTVKRDLSLSVPQGVLASKVKEVLGKSAKNLIKKLYVFDYYNPNKEDIYYNLAIRISFQSEEKTLSDADVDEVIEKALENLDKKLLVKLKLFTI